MVKVTKMKGNLKLKNYKDAKILGKKYLRK